jgi:hypothetical protein
MAGLERFDPFTSTTRAKGVKNPLLIDKNDVVTRFFAKTSAFLAFRGHSDPRGVLSIKLRLQSVYPSRATAAPHGARPGLSVVINGGMAAFLAKRVLIGALGVLRIDKTGATSER